MAGTRHRAARPGSPAAPPRRAPQIVLIGELLGLAPRQLDHDRAVDQVPGAGEVRDAVDQLRPADLEQRLVVVAVERAGAEAGAGGDPAHGVGQVLVEPAQVVEGTSQPLEAAMTRSRSSRGGVLRRPVRVDQPAQHPGQRRLAGALLAVDGKDRYGPRGRKRPTSQPTRARQRVAPVRSMPSAWRGRAASGFGQGQHARRADEAERAGRATMRQPSASISTADQIVIAQVEVDRRSRRRRSASSACRAGHGPHRLDRFSASVRPGCRARSGASRRSARRSRADRRTRAPASGECQPRTR